jgi:hypothetical protein
MKAFLRPTLSLLIFLIAVPAVLAQSAGVVRGKVTATGGAVMPGVAVQLRNDITGFKKDTTTNANGVFQFYDVPFNPYELHVEVQGFAPVHRHIQVRSAIPLDVGVDLSLPTLSETISVVGEPTAAQLETDTSTSHIDIDKSYIATVPAAVASRAMEQLVTSTPGFAKDENGRFHFQGAHSQSEYVIDGQTISDQTGVTFSNSIDPGIAQSIEVIYGNVPAEFGEKIGAVISLTTKTGLGSGKFNGDAFAGGSRFSTMEGGFSAGQGTDQFGVFGSVTASTSHRFLDPINFSNLHNRGNTARGFFRLDDALSPHATIRFTSLLGRTSRDVPNTFTQEAAGQNQRVQSSDQNFNLGWQDIASNTELADASLFARFSRFSLLPSDNDTPVTAESHRTLNNYGIAPSYSWQLHNNDVKIGGTYKRFPIHERFSFRITDPGFNDPASETFNPNIKQYDLTRGGSPFVFSENRTGAYYALYAQDNLKVGNLTANLGVRYDHNNLPSSDKLIEPRVGFAYYLPSTRTVLRASYNRVLYTPEYENILFSSSAAAPKLVPPEVQASRELGCGVLLVPSERQQAYDIGVQQALGSKVRLDVDVWRRRSTFAGDQDQFENTGIVFPLAFSAGKFNGWNVRLDSAPVNGFRGFLSAGHTRAIYVPPPAGGLFLDVGAIDAITGGPFLIDHDQKLQAQAMLQYEAGNAWVGANVRYDSGLVGGDDPAGIAADPDNSFALPFIAIHSGAELDPNRIKPRTIADFSAGVTFGKVRVQADLLNAFDKKGVYNILSVFGGTHVIPPRMFAARIRYAF